MAQRYQEDGYFPYMMPVQVAKNGYAVITCEYFSNYIEHQNEFGKDYW